MTLTSSAFVTAAGMQPPTDSVYHLAEPPEVALRAAGRSLLLDASALKAMELLSEVAILHRVRFAMTPNDSKLTAAIDVYNQR